MALYTPSAAYLAVVEGASAWVRCPGTKVYSAVESRTAAAILGPTTLSEATVIVSVF